MQLTGCLLPDRSCRPGDRAVVTAGFRDARHAQPPVPKFTYPGGCLRYTVGKAKGSVQALPLELLGGFSDRALPVRPSIAQRGHSARKS